MGQEKYCLIHLKENADIEVKESSGKVPESFYETYSSFANAHGGTIYLGIKKGEGNVITGVPNPYSRKKA